jgi:hypothetical protein
MRRDQPRAFLWASVATGVLLAVLTAHLVTAMVAGGPVAVPDVPAYLGIAQWVGGDGLAPGGLPFQPGYGLLLAPLVAAAQVARLGAQGEAVHALALVVNALAAAAAVVAAARLSWVCSRRWWVAGAAGLAAAVHPSLSSASRIAWPETLLTLAVLLVAIAVAEAVTHAGAAVSQRAWARAGLFATLSVALHARMVVLVMAVVGTALLCRIDRRAWAGLGTGLAAGGAATALALTLTDTWPTARLSEATQLDRGAEPIATVLGQLLALGGGTVGLGLVGLVTGLGAACSMCRKAPADSSARPAARNLPAATTAVPPDTADHPGPQRRISMRRAPGTPRRVSERKTPEPLAAALVCLSLGALGALLLGGWTLTGSARADALLYGRYVDPWAVPLAAVALAWLAARPATPCSESLSSDAEALSRPLVKPTSKTARRSKLPSGGSAVLATATVVAAAACVVVVAVADSYDATPRRIMTLSFSPAWTWLDERLSAVAVAALVSTFAGLLLAAVALRGHAATDGDDESTERESNVSASPPASGVHLGTARRRSIARPDAVLGMLAAAVFALGAVATVSNHRHLSDVGTVARDQVVSAGTVSDAVDDGLTCLAHDQTSVPEYALWLYRLELPEIGHERVRLDAGDRPCSEFVIAHDDLAQRCTNARHLVDEPAASWSLWHLPGRACASALNRGAWAAGVASHDGTHDSGVHSG